MSKLLTSLQWLSLLLAAPFLLFPSPQRSPALLVIPLFWLIFLIARRNPLPVNPLNPALLLLNLMVLVSLYATYDIAASLPKIAGLVLGSGLFFAILRLGSTLRGWWFSLTVFLGLGLGVSGLGLLGMRSIQTKIHLLDPLTSRLGPRFTGLPGAPEGIHPNEVAGALTWVIPTAIALLYALVRYYGPLSRNIARLRSLVLVLFASLAAVFLTAVLILTQSRSGYLALGLTLPFLLWLALPWRGRIALGGMVALVAAGAGAWFAWGDGMVVLQPYLGSELASDPAFSLNTLEGRMEIWSRAIYGIQDFPLTGMGLNTFRRVIQVLYPLFRIGPEVDIGHAHNEFLQAALDLGIPGLIAFITLHLGALGMTLAIVRRSKPRLGNPAGESPTASHSINPSGSNPTCSPVPGRLEGVSPGPTLSDRLLSILSVGLLAGLFCHLLYGLTDAVALGAKPGFLFWISLALLTSAYLRPAQRIPTPSSNASSPIPILFP